MHLPLYIENCVLRALNGYYWVSLEIIKSDRIMERSELKGYVNDFDQARSEILNLLRRA